MNHHYKRQNWQPEVKRSKIVSGTLGQTPIKSPKHPMQGNQIEATVA
jgi:hypothetical protein